MNSSQRRKLKRELPYSIYLEAEQGMPYFEHDDKVLDARHWCKRHTTGTHKVTTFWDKAVFNFSNEGDAVHFALKWL